MAIRSTFLIQQFFNIGRDILGLRIRAVTLHGIAFFVDEKLCEVPFDHLGAEDARLFGSQVLKERVRIFAVDIDLTEHREFDAIVELAEFLDLVGGAGFLRTELVAGKAQNHETPVFVFFVNCLEPCKLRRKTALARGIDDEYNLAFVIGKGYFFATDRGGAEFVDGRCHALRDRKAR